jgi:3-oxoadipate enol-lactonase
MTRACYWVAIALALSLPGRLHAADTTWVEADGVSLRYELSGNGPGTVVLLHEMGMTLESWDDVVPGLRLKHRVLRYDLRGFGLSEKIRDAVTLDTGIHDLHSLLQALRISGQVSLIGGAIGGSIALAYAIRYPERVNGLVLISPVIAGPPRPGTIAAPAASSTGPRIDNSPAGIIERDGVRAYLSSQTESVYPASLQTPERLRRFRAMQLSSDPVGRVLTTRAMSAVNLAPEVSRVQTPTLVVGTTMFIGFSGSRTLAESIPGARFEAIETGHFAALESPQLLLPVLQRFLNGLASSRAAAR